MGGRSIKLKKYIVNFLQSGIGILIIFTVIVCLYTLLYISYTRPRDIQYKYNGIKYQIGNLQSAEPINIEVKGKYVKGLFGKYVEFDGTIKVGNKIFTCKPITFNKYKMSSLESSEGPYGMIYIGDMFEKLTIEILEPNQNGGYSWSGENGWMISAPCNDRKEAVEISNKLIQKFYKNQVIK